LHTLCRPVVLSRGRCGFVAAGGGRGCVSGMYCPPQRGGCQWCLLVVVLLVFFPHWCFGGGDCDSERKSVAPPPWFCVYVCREIRCGGASARIISEPPLTAVYPPRGDRAPTAYQPPWPPPRNRGGLWLYRRVFFRVTIWGRETSHQQPTLNDRFIGYWGGPVMYESEHTSPRVAARRVALYAVLRGVFAFVLHRPKHPPMADKPCI